MYLIAALKKLREEASAGNPNRLNGSQNCSIIRSKKVNSPAGLPNTSDNFSRGTIESTGLFDGCFQNRKLRRV